MTHETSGELPYLYRKKNNAIFFFPCVYVGDHGDDIRDNRRAPNAVQLPSTDGSFGSRLFRVLLGSILI